MSDIPRLVWKDKCTYEMSYGIPCTLIHGHIPPVRTVLLYYVGQWDVLPVCTLVHCHIPHVRTVPLYYVGQWDVLPVCTLVHCHIPHVRTVPLYYVGQWDVLWNPMYTHPTVLRGVMNGSAYCWSQLAICWEYSSRDRFYLFVSTKASLNFSSCSSGTGTL